MLPKSWEPKQAGGMLLIGPQEDGGYIVSRRSIEPVTLLISMGLNDDWRFEEDFRRRTGAAIRCFDGTVDARFWKVHLLKSIMQLRPARTPLTYLRYRRFFSSPQVIHERKMIGYSVPGCVSFDDIMNTVTDRSIFLKVDIEGSEYRILDQVVKHADRITGMVFEFHHVDLHKDRIDRFINALNDFSVVVVHSNNRAGADPEGDPVVLEMTLARNNFIDPPDVGELPIAMPPSVESMPDIALRYG